MKKFVFQLETFLKISKIEREKAEIAMAMAVKNFQKQNEIHLSLQKELANSLMEYEQILLKNKVNVNLLQIYGDFFSWKRYQIDLQKTAIKKAEKQQKECLVNLLKHEKQVKSLEQIRQKRFDEYKYEMLAEEQKQIDEIGLQIHMRKIIMEES
ncbi:flagellar export protein FliJ [Pectinatus sottacetonis]|uniref:flagellar export protein FliJ n=1 Tax=Pectinatus sottacetonis TaxID=1002795 RepID=UPI0018C78376|nr:flagellar FliJ family protein [Pectinatus sottacetonis]